jgi:hypothetical protein
MTRDQRDNWTLYLTALLAVLAVVEFWRDRKRDQAA